MLTAQEQAEILALAEELAKARVIAVQKAGVRDKTFDEFINKQGRHKPAYVLIRERLIDTLKEAG